ncbi:DUF418 domain-containing protein [Psychrobacillus psychrodurans]|uniref:DUF418 domain-containing protein n=1 Tax=Psychrobacillus psychrodurans TaxID=126157 RepID=UPI0008EA65BD|nr:DUF418 domain-containing protein [Psychrobacillus psychrodurans]MCZ8539265.1 DUF418 domain-containing protein [Psychrobacillus psychrodurans]SFM35217.1 uncharacterized protein SAMN05421832_10296 [Psychrobacillus psychrodurans]
MLIKPTGVNERIISIDVMRGFALLGIFVVNMLFFHTPYIYINPYTWYQNPSDYETFKMIDIFVQGSVYPLFSMLFGYGLAMQYMKSEANGSPFSKFAVRRLSVLLIIGCIHAFLIWAGDILITYALAGFVLILIIRLKPIWLLLISIFLFLIPNGLLNGLVYLGSLIEPDAMVIYTGIQGIEASIVAYGQGSWGDIFSQRLADWLYMSGNGLIIISMLFTIVPFLLLGAAAAKWKLIERARELKLFWSVTVLVTLIAGTAIKWLPYLTEANLFTMSVQDTFGGPLQAIAYAGVIAMVCSIPIGAKILSPISKAGRMSMTIYLMQSIIATTIFYSYGFGLYGKIDISTGTWMAVGIFALQIVFAEFWFMKFKQGPVELLWRKLTYSNSLSKIGEKETNL